ncbi:MAG: lasso peptide biosynthesis B2 protein [Chloroflexi bacterium]|nr:lasso peptide biosynthesis B2 protein [Chloroflexota bacterium]MCI0580507.1 lasso peptide biosynthesis B2 protein [Chloroflexota bacterium]MCI0643558.1 lasso peptide biosynthesis B2 protein [Chloroflexota bacterium]MCI0729648.1 lasso peptide biosynthesis B2 protein [Chloroflexota bacterium]
MALTTTLRRASRLPAVRRLRPLWWPLLIRLRHLWLLPGSLPGLAGNPGRRALLQEMRAFVRQLPDRMRVPLPEVMAQLTAEDSPARPEKEQERVIRDLADLATLLERRSPLGVCLRRSLTRYYFLRRAGLPVAVHFGARFVDGKPDRAITGHAWLTLDGKAYYEPGVNWRGFTVVFSFPPNDEETSHEP